MSASPGSANPSLADAGTAGVPVVGIDRLPGARPTRAELLAPIEGERIEIEGADGGSLNVLVAGPEKGIPIVLLHGWTCSHEFWKLQIRALSSEFRVIAYDHRGHGESERSRREDYSTAALADDLGIVLDAFVPRRRKAILAGHSMGGITIVAWARRRPEKVRARAAAAVLVNTGMGDLISQALILQTPNPLAWFRREIGRGLITLAAPIAPGSSRVGSLLARYIALGPDASRDEAEFCERLIRSCRADVRAGFGDSLAMLDLHDGVQHLRIPTMVIAGEHDRLTPVRHSQTLAESLPEPLGLVEVGGCGHMTPLELPSEVTRRIAAVAREHG